MITKPATAAEIVAGVRRPAGLQAAQAALEGLHARRQEAHTALLEAIRVQADSDRASTGSPSARHIEQLGRDLADLDEKIRAATAEGTEARLPYTASVQTALTPMRRAAVDAAVNAINDLTTALRLIDEVSREIERAGGTGMRFPAIYRNGVAALRARLRAQLRN
jgi:hypothetical protein